MSGQYTHLLLATDLHEDNLCVLARAQAMAAQNSARLSLIHVVENIPVYFGSDLVSPVWPDTEELERQIVDVARQRMANWAREYDLNGDDCHVLSGPVKFEINAFAEEHAVDLIVIGSHGRHGLSRLLGSTARAVLNSAPCDVLAVRMKAE